MPYIKQSERCKFEEGLQKLTPGNAGDLNYLFTSIAHEYIDRMGLRYEHINAVVGALECSKLELYRRVAIGYENQKIAENGDVMRDFGGGAK